MAILQMHGFTPFTWGYAVSMRLCSIHEVTNSHCLHGVTALAWGYVWYAALKIETGFARKIAGGFGNGWTLIHTSAADCTVRIFAPIRSQ